MQVENEEIILSEMEQVRRILSLKSTDQIVYNDVGWTSRVYLVRKGELVVKFPRKESVRQEYLQEASAYLALQDQELVQVPKLIEIGTNGDYLSYQGLVGETLDRVANLGASKKVELASTLARFLSYLHSLNVQGFSSYSIESEIRKGQEKYQQCKSSIHEKLDKAQIKALERFIYVNFCDELLGNESDLVFSHGDIGLWNLVLTKENDLGIIDFGDAGYYDRSTDFSSVMDETIFKSLEENYGFDEPLSRKVLVRRLMLPILEIPYFLGKGKFDEFEKNIKRIQENIALYSGLS